MKSSGNDAHRPSISSAFIMAKITMEDGKNALKTLRSVHLFRYAIRHRLAAPWRQP
jgi:hypothetical protein